MRLSRLFEIVYLLMDKKSMTASALAAHFEVSTRTILRDIDALSAAGVPIYTMQGKGGGIGIHESYVLNKTVITEEEQNQILFALQGLSATEYIEPGGIHGRLQSLFNKADNNWIEVDFSRWGNSAADREKFEVLKEALIRRKSLSFLYSTSYGKTRERRVYPLKLAFKSKSWYLQVFCLIKNDYRTFKISRMRNIRLEDETFDIRRFNPPPMETMEMRASALITLTLRFSPEIAYRVYDEFDDSDIRLSEDGSCTVSRNFPDDDWLCSYVFSFGDQVEVLAPQKLRDEMLMRIERMKEKYLK